MCSATLRRWSTPEMVDPQLDGPQLAALAAVVELGSFDAAAERLHVTPSAVSQRIKSLEQQVGQVLVVREKPCRATTAGIPLLRLAAQTALLESEALAEMGGNASLKRTRITIAVNADSMATWFSAVFDGLGDVLLDVRIEDQDHSARLLREGVAMGAVTTERNPVPGCRVHPLGEMRYLPVASRPFVQRHLSDGFTAAAAAKAPSLAWNRDDGLQDMLVRKAFRRAIPDRRTLSRPQRASPPQRAPGWDGACSPRSWQHLRLPMDRSYGSATYTSTSLSIGNAGNWTVRSSRELPTR